MEEKKKREARLPNLILSTSLPLGIPRTILNKAVVFELQKYWNLGVDEDEARAEAGGI